MSSNQEHIVDEVNLDYLMDERDFYYELEHNFVNLDKKNWLRCITGKGLVMLYEDGWHIKIIPSNS